MPLSGARLKRCISPVARCSSVAAISAVSVVEPIVSRVVARPMFGWPIWASAGTTVSMMGRPNSNRVSRIIGRTRLRDSMSIGAGRRRHSTKLASVNPAIPNASAHSEWERNGAIVPALTADSEKCRKPCSDEASPRIVGNRSRSSSMIVGMMIAEPIEKTKIGATCHGTPGANNATIARFSATPANANAKPSRTVRRGENRPASRPEMSSANHDPADHRHEQPRESIGRNAEQIDQVHRRRRNVQEERREVERGNQRQQQEVRAREHRAIVAPERARMQRLTRGGRKRLRQCPPGPCERERASAPAATRRSIASRACSGARRRSRERSLAQGRRSASLATSGVAPPDPGSGRG